MKIIKSKRFENGRFNYSIKYKQFQMKDADSEKKQLYHAEEVKFYKFPFTFGKIIECGLCEDTREYYRQ